MVLFSKRVKQKSYYFLYDFLVLYLYSVNKHTQNINTQHDYKYQEN